ncbi:MAG: hypothetical protein SCALA702_04680 [Melioribacteraceae bacterium]|nr:MAG: hypothetical protein SCALA702_04680 [Melioribacteraceae bacterium]
MKNYLYPAVGIIAVTVILVLVNEFTTSTFIKDYAIILIIAGMLLGTWLSKLSDKTNDNA